jgi:hypothetical protein
MNLNVIDRVTLIYHSIPEKGVVFVCVTVPFLWVLTLLFYEYMSAKIEIWKDKRLKDASN